MITSRPLPEAELAEFRSRETGLFVLRPFSSDDLYNFAVKWYRARTPDDDPETQEVAALRLTSRMHASGLTSMVRIPLIATMAALLYTADPDAELPGSRAELYRSFVDLLRSGRADEKGSSPQAAWLSGVQERLIEALAGRYMEDADANLVEAANRWAEEHAPRSLSRPVGGWSGRVRDRLIRSGLFGSAAGEVVFLHRSLAEYVAAGPASYRQESWRADVRPGGRRRPAGPRVRRSALPMTVPRRTRHGRRQVPYPRGHGQCW